MKKSVMGSGDERHVDRRVIRVAKTQQQTNSGNGACDRLEQDVGDEHIGVHGDGRTKDDGLGDVEDGRHQSDLESVL